MDRETSIWMTYDVSMIFLKTYQRAIAIFSSDGGHLLAGVERSAKGFGFEIFRHFCHQACAVRRSRSELLFGFHAIRHHWQIESPTESNHRANESAQRRFT